MLSPNLEITRPPKVNKAENQKSLNCLCYVALTALNIDAKLLAWVNSTQINFLMLINFRKMQIRNCKPFDKCQ